VEIIPGDGINAQKAAMELILVMRLVPGKWQKKLVPMKGLMPDKRQNKLVLQMEIRFGSGHEELIFPGIKINV